jgi:hypothetical protein
VLPDGLLISEQGTTYLTAASSPTAAATHRVGHLLRLVCGYAPSPLCCKHVDMNMFWHSTTVPPLAVLA